MGVHGSCLYIIKGLGAVIDQLSQILFFNFFCPVTSSRVNEGAVSRPSPWNHVVCSLVIEANILPYSTWSEIDFFFFAKYVCVSHSIMSDAVQPHGLQPTRLLCPWHSPGKNTGVGSHFLFQGSISPPVMVVDFMSPVRNSDTGRIFVI